jgi:hypothetical protein
MTPPLADRNDHSDYPVLLAEHRASMLGSEHGDFRFVPEFLSLVPGVLSMPTSHRKRTLSLIGQRMAEDMRLRNMALRTIDTYTYHIERFSKHFGRPLDELGPDEIRQFQLYLIEDRKASWSSFNQLSVGYASSTTSRCPGPGPCSRFHLASGPRSCRPSWDPRKSFG